jgi:hypothetical protein
MAQMKKTKQGAKDIAQMKKPYRGRRIWLK